MEGTDEWVRLNAMNLRDIEGDMPRVSEDSLDLRQPHQAPTDEPPTPAFTIFALFPPEIRFQIWGLALESRIIQWVRKRHRNVFSAPSKSLPLFAVCHESRDAVILYGQYTKLPAESGHVWFSPIVDFLLFSPFWLHQEDDSQLVQYVDPLDSVLPQLANVRSIMVHPNYTDHRKKPTTMFEKFTRLERILVAADEKVIASNSKFMLGTMYDIKMYYLATVRKRQPNITLPYIAVGCLGWVGNERRKMHHGDEDNRKLLAVCVNHAQMMHHLNAVREEEWRFIQERRFRARLPINPRWHHDPQITRQSSSSGSEFRPAYNELPSYSIVTPQYTASSIPEPAVIWKDPIKSRWERLKLWCRKVVHR